MKFLRAPFVGNSANKQPDRPQMELPQSTVFSHRRLQSLIKRLTERCVIRGRGAYISEDEVMSLATKCAEIFANEPVCLEINLRRPLLIVGDLFGQHDNLVEIFEQLGSPAKQRYLFLGNFVDRGGQSVELISLLFVYKLLYPYNVYLIRGNHECKYVSTYYGLLWECWQRQFVGAWKAIMKAFECLPAVAIIDKGVFCTHSGILKDIPMEPVSNLTDLKNFINLQVTRPVSSIKNRILTEFTWSEPTLGGFSWIPNPAGLGYLYPEQAVVHFCERFGFQQVIRSHDLVRFGYEFSADGKLLTVFSRPRLVKKPPNSGALVRLNKLPRGKLIVGQIKLMQTVSMFGRVSPIATFIN
ncbi:hypothetical protein CRM22_003936 [Opisthorchis felineus]|uniref:Serine/threonine-protein phosphatase n=1 Tax=Opisthorchis felineus TaxID=147828 RepID=A0A4S2M3W0_OPIFE|nr:hypothetical protein CRM22_003936 [Opisthorchis felineus]